jgi:hypothetical protein
VYPIPFRKYGPYFGRKEKLKKDAGDILENRLLHHITESFR